MTLPSVLGCQVCSALEKQNVPKDKVFFGAKCASAEKKVPQITLRTRIFKRIANAFKYFYCVSLEVLQRISNQY